MTSVTTEDGGRPKVGPRRDMRMADDYHADLEALGGSNASRGLRNLVRFARAHRAQVETWLMENPENLKADSGASAKRRATKRGRKK